MNVAALLDEIDELFDGIPTHAANSSKIEDLYEAFLMGLVLEAARRIDPTSVSWHDVGGGPAAAARLRAGPGQIYTSPYTHARLTFNGDPVYEVHLGVMVRGLKAAHECDVVVLHAGIAASRRHSGSTPQWHDSLFALEAKAYERTAVDIKLARQVVGVAVDLSHQGIGLVAARDIDPPAEALIDGWARLLAWGPVKPGGPLSDKLVDFLEGFLRN